MRKKELLATMTILAVIATTMFPSAYARQSDEREPRAALSESSSWAIQNDRDGDLGFLLGVFRGEEVSFGVPRAFIDELNKPGFLYSESLPALGVVTVSVGDETQELSSTFLNDLFEFQRKAANDISVDEYNSFSGTDLGVMEWLFREIGGVDVFVAAIDQLLLDTHGDWIRSPNVRGPDCAMAGAGTLLAIGGSMGCCAVTAGVGCALCGYGAALVLAATLLCLSQLPPIPAPQPPGDGGNPLPSCGPNQIVGCVCDIGCLPPGEEGPEYACCY